MVLLDLYYIENISLLFDLEILFATIPVVMFGPRRLLVKPSEGKGCASIN